MASGSQGPKQSRGYFVPLANCVGKVYTYTPGSGAGGSFLPGSFATASGAWTTDSRVSTIAAINAGGLLKDMGKTVVSSNRTFRKVQLVATGAANESYTPVNGGSSGNSPYLTGYIELATGNQLAVAGNAVAPVAFMSGLL
jgi:hypothetical protein